MSEKYELTGTIKIIGDVQTFPSGFMKQQFVITTEDDKYPQDIALEFAKDACAKLDAFHPGDGAKVTFNIRGNEYQGKFYVQLSAWKIEKTSDGVGVRSPEYGKRETSQGGAPPPSRTATADALDEPEDDIPF